MRIGIVIQARMGSTRLPGKVLRPFYNGESILQLLLTRLQRNSLSLPVIIATTSDPQDDQIVELANRLNIAVHRGPTTDVLQRFIDCSVANRLDALVRVCADNPFLDISLLEHLVVRGREAEAQYAGYILDNGTPAIKSHIGLFAEYVTRKALDRVSATTTSPEAREHVTKHIYEHPGEYKLLLIDAPKDLALLRDTRLTVDSIEDFQTASEIYMLLQKSGHTIEAKNLHRVLTTRNDLLSAMTRQIKLNCK